MAAARLCSSKMTGMTLDYHHDSISLQVIDALANVTGTDAYDLDPLYNAVDPEALDRVIQSASSAAICVEFEYEGHSVAVQGDGTVVVDDTVYDGA